MSRRRVVVTGMGALAPNGNGVEAFWEALVDGRSGIGPITRFDATDFDIKIAGELTDFDPEVALDRKEVRRNDRFVHYGVHVAPEAARAAGVAMAVMAARRGQNSFADSAPRAAGEGAGASESVLRAEHVQRHVRRHDLHEAGCQGSQLHHGLGLRLCRPRHRRGRS